MENPDQERFLNDFDFIQIHPKVHQRHKEYLRSIDENESRAVRDIIDFHMRFTRRMMFERSILYIILLLCFLMFGLIILTMY